MSPFMLHHSFSSLSMSITIQSTWDGRALPACDQVHITMSSDEDNLVILVDAPFYSDPSPPSSDRNCEGLWNHEVVEVFIKGRHDKYIEVEMGPHGHYLILACDSYRQCFARRLEPVEYVANITNGRWTGTIQIPIKFLPPATGISGSQFSYNVYSIHGEGENRSFACGFPPKSISPPDFHRLELFQPLTAIGDSLAAQVNEEKSIWHSRRALSMSFPTVRE